MSTKPVSNYFPQLLLVLSTALAVCDWYLRPERPMAWIVALLLIGCMTFALLKLPGGAKGEIAQYQLGTSVRSGVVWAGAILAIALGSKLGGTLGAPNISWRATMAIIGVFLIFTGNAIPKMLTPLSQMQCDPAKLQAFQRFGGWTWVLTGFVLLNAWLVLPVRLADEVSYITLPLAIIVIAIQWLRLRHSQPSTL